jgi:hypothetical protein
MANFSFCDTETENDWVYTPNQGALRCVPPAPLSRLAGYALAVLRHQELLGMVCYGHRGSTTSPCQTISLGHCTVGIDTQMKSRSANCIFGSRRTINWHRSSDQVTSRCENIHRGYIYSFTEVLNWCIVILARSPVSLSSAYALANSQIEFRFRIIN